MRLPKKRTAGFARISSVLGLDGLDHFFEIGEDFIRWDFNLSRLPYFVAGDKRHQRFRSLLVTESVEKDGKQFQAEWRVICHPELGLPGSFDRDVWIGILQIVREITDNGKQPVPDIIELGTVYGFLKRIGKPTDGRYVKMFKDSIERLATTGCVSKGTFNCPASGGYINLGEVFHLIRSWGFKGEPSTGGGVNETNFVVLDPIIRRNLDTFYVSLLRVEFMRGLKGDIAKLLYPLLSYRFWRATQNRESYWRVKWSELIRYIALFEVESLKRAKDTLKPALQELKIKGYIAEQSDWDGEYYVFYPGLEYTKEHQQKVNAKDNYRARAQAPKGPTPEYLAAIKVSKALLPKKEEEKSDDRANEISRQAARLQLGKPLLPERLDLFKITSEEVHAALAALEKRS